MGLAREGAKVMVNYFGKPADSDDMINQIKAAGSNAIGIDADVYKPKDLANLSLCPRPRPEFRPEEALCQGSAKRGLL